jgi:hypothetical protein
MDFTPEKLEVLAEECSKLGDEYAAFVHEEKIFSVASAAYLAALVMEFKEKYPDESNVSLETRSRASDGWKKFTREHLEFLKKAGRTWVKYEEAKRRWETERSLLAERRERYKHV